MYVTIFKLRNYYIGWFKKKFKSHKFKNHIVKTYTKLAMLLSIQNFRLVVNKLILFRVSFEVQGSDEQFLSDVN